MRPEWLPYSAAALVTGGLTLMLSQFLVPSLWGMSTEELLRHAEQGGATWVTMGLLWALSSVCFILGAPTIVTLFRRRGKHLGWAGVVLLAVGSVGFSALAALALLVRGLALHDVDPAVVTAALDDVGFLALRRVWVAAFFAGFMLVALALIRARSLPAWVPALLVVFVVVVLLPVGLGTVRAGAYVALAIAVTGMAVHAVMPRWDDDRPRTTSASPRAP